MISDIKNIWRQCAQTLQFQIVVKMATVFIIIISNNVKAAELPSNIFVSLPVIGQKIHLSKSIDDPEIQLVAFDEEVKFPSLKASAGDDVLAYVGRRATLNGGLSQPEGRIGSRWIQISGPPILDAVAQGPNLIVVVPAAGTYQFLLVVAEAGIISEPDSVTLVAVDHPEDVARQQAKQASPPAPTESVAPRDLIVRLTRKVLGEVPHSLGIANSLSELFADISQKMNLYTNYAEAHQEMSRRITDLIDAESVDMQVWNSRVFEPLTQALSTWVRPAGLDLTDKSQWVQPFSPIARSTMASGLSAISEGFLERPPIKKVSASPLQGQ
jgi:hypothetical protein